MNREMTDELIGYVIEDMTELYNISEEEAGRLVKAYNFREILLEHPSEITHYPPDYWAERIYAHQISKIVKF